MILHPNVDRRTTSNVISEWPTKSGAIHSSFYESVSETVSGAWPIFSTDFLKPNTHFKMLKIG